jgi:thioredoxin reductase
MKPSQRSCSTVSGTVRDAVVIGGGPAGLSAALILGRCRRNVVLFDAGKPRNGPSRALHGFLSRDGTPPSELLAASRAQLAEYDTVAVRQEEIVDAAKAGGLFHIAPARGPEVQTRAVLLATGLTDRLPELHGIEKFYGRSVHHCPYCDGWEHRDEPLGVLGADRNAVALATELRVWSDQVTLCTNGCSELPAEAVRALDTAKIPRVDTPVQSLEGDGDQLETIHFSDGTTLSVRALFFYPLQTQHSPLGIKLGCRLTEAEDAVKCESGSETCIPGVFAAGNITGGLELAIVAAAAGARAGVAINEYLVRLSEPKFSPPPN